MKRASIAAIAIMVIVVVIVAAFAYEEYVYYTPGKILGPVETVTVQGNGSTIVIPSGETIVINSTDNGARAGPMISATSPIYHYVICELHVKGYYILTGSWHSTVASLFLVYGNMTVFIDPPRPYETHGIINRTLSPGYYTIEIGGWVGDRIAITGSIVAKSYYPYRVGSFYLPSGTVITGPRTYSVYLNQSASLTGSFTVGGAFWFSINSSSGSSSFGSYNSSSKPLLHSFNPFGQNSFPPVGPGMVDVTFAEGTFYINQTMEFVYYVDSST